MVLRILGGSGAVGNSGMSLHNTLNCVFTLNWKCWPSNTRIDERREVEDMKGQELEDMEGQEQEGREPEEEEDLEQEVHGVEVHGVEVHGVEAQVVEGPEEARVEIIPCLSVSARDKCPTGLRGRVQQRKTQQRKMPLSGAQGKVHQRISQA